MNRALYPMIALAAAGCAAAESRPRPQKIAQPEAAPELSADALRAKGPGGLAIALAKYDALEAGPAKDQQALVVDQVAGQRYASVSRLYWYTDMDRAKEVATRTGRPILSLRLLGRLDEDYSCANSRMFRTVLYANAAVSSFMRDNFTLHWSSERDVPKVSIDFGGGRTMKTTIAGNSAHYLLDHEGNPIDVLPGLYGPESFVQALVPALALEKRVRGKESARDEVRRFHINRAVTDTGSFQKLSPAQRTALEPYRRRRFTTELLMAEMLTVRKAYVEMPIVELAGLGGVPETDLDPIAVHRSVSRVERIDAASRDLIVAMGPTDWGANPAQLSGEGLASMLAELEKSVAGDTLINEFGLRPMISRMFAQQMGEDFESLNKTIYTEVFVTPRSDPWLGLAQPTGFTGLPSDGLSVVALNNLPTPL